MTTQEKIYKLQEAIALLKDANNIQQSVLNDPLSLSEDIHNALQAIIWDIEDEITNLKDPVE